MQTKDLKEEIIRLLEEYRMDKTLQISNYKKLPDPINYYVDEIANIIDHAIQSAVKEREKEILFEFAKWWSDDQTKDAEDYVKRASRSEAIKVVKEFLSELSKKGE